MSDRRSRTPFHEGVLQPGDFPVLNPSADGGIGGSAPSSSSRTRWESQFVSQKPHYVHNKPLYNFITNDGPRYQTKTLRLDFPKQVVSVMDALCVKKSDIAVFATKFYVRFWDDYSEEILPALDAFKLTLQVITGTSGPDSDRVKVGRHAFSKASFSIALTSKFIITSGLSMPSTAIPQVVGPDGLSLPTGENVRIVNRPLILGRPEEQPPHPWDDKSNPEYWDSDGNSRSGREDELRWD